MQWNQIDKSDNQREVTAAFLGYNHNPIIEDGEFYDMENLTSDHYPLLSPRKKRKLQLQVASNTWESLTFTITTRSEASVSEAIAIYQSNSITVGGNEYVHITYDVDNTMISQVTGTVTFSDGSSTPLSEYVTTPAGCESMTFELYAKAIDPATYDPEDIDTYVYNIAAEYRNDNVRGILCKAGKLAYLIKQTLYYNEASYDLSAYMTGDDGVNEQTLLSYGAYILIFPAAVYLNTVDTTDKGALGHKNSLSGTVTYSIVDREGTALNPTVSATEPSTPADGDYWLDTRTESYGLYVWTDTLKYWQAVLTTYIKIALTGIGAGFSEGDAVFMNTKLQDINNGSILQKVDADYIIVTAIMDKASDTESFTSDNPFIIERRIPTLDYVCVNNNRVWGCRAGEEAGQIVNEIHACKLGDPKNWYSFAGIASDSYTLSIGADGEFTGAVSFQGYPTFFKENVVYRIYGSYPAQYQLITYECRGVQQGSAKSIAIVGEYLVYKSVKDICIFDGGSPTNISTQLGETMYHSAVAGSSLMKYYISMLDEEDVPHLFVYDLAKRMWHREDNLRIEEFTYNNSGQLYGRDGIKIYGFGYAKDQLTLSEGQGEQHVFWNAVTGIYYAGGHTYPVRVTMRALIPFKSEVTVEVSYDDGEWEEQETLRGEDKIKSYSFTVKSKRCDHFRIKLSGRDECKLYSIMREVEVGSTWNG